MNKVKYKWPYMADETHCIHGVFVGYPGGPDYMCQFCENGEVTWVEDPLWRLMITFDIDGRQVDLPTRVQWRTSSLCEAVPDVVRVASMYVEAAMYPTVVWAKMESRGYWE